MVLVRDQKASFFKEFYGISREAPNASPKAKGYMTADHRSRISVGTIPMVYRRAHLFVAGHTFYWCTADQRRFRMRDEMASGNLSSVIYDAPRRTGASIVTAKRDHDVPRIRRDPPTCGHCVLAQCVDYRSWFCR